MRDAWFQCILSILKQNSGHHYLKCFICERQLKKKLYFSPFRMKKKYKKLKPKKLLLSKIH